MAIKTNIQPIGFEKVKIGSSLAGRYQQMVREKMIPYQWEVLNDRIPGVAKSHAIDNFRIAAGLEEGDFYGEVFQDTDVAKWIEGAAYSLVLSPDPELEERIDALIEVIGQAQEKDGYLNTYFSIRDLSKRWTDLCECHELYTAGHMTEAAVAYYQATGKRKFLDIMCRFADYIAETFGEKEGQIQGYPGHQEIELALIRLYEVTGEKKYLELSRYFLRKRGEEPNYFLREWETTRNRCTFKTDTYTPPPYLPYFQAHKSVYEQDKAVGHAVRAMYMYTAMADLARITGDEKMLRSCKTLWDNVVNRQMFITGAVGSTHVGESFTFDYDLPNETAYTETCASVGLIFFAHRMMQIQIKGEYADIIEKVLFNALFASVSQDGKSFFYVNPLEIWPEASEKNPDRQHIKPVRQSWYGCACCPPNIMRLISSLGGYLYSASEDTVYVHQYIPSETTLSLSGQQVTIRQSGNYPWEDEVTIDLTSSGPSAEAENKKAHGPENHPQDRLPVRLALRIPGWCRDYEVTVDGQKQTGICTDGYLLLQEIRPSARIKIRLNMPPVYMHANGLVRSVNGKAAVQRGPVVYCLEEKDNGKGLNLLRLDTKRQPVCSCAEGLPEGIPAITCEGYALQNAGEDAPLYSSAAPEEAPVQITAVPYFLWGSRGYGEMQVWTRV